MAVETTNALSGPFIPNGVTTTFPFTFTAPSADEVDVMLRAADGTETLAVGYAVTLNPSGGGSVVFSVAPAAGPELYILLEPFFTQQIQFENGSGWLAEPVNEVADRSAARDQVLRREIGRSLRMPLGEDPGQLPRKAQLAGKFIGGDGVGNPIALSGTGNDPDFRTDTADPDIGGRLFGHKSRMANGKARELDGKAGERVSWLDLLPYNKHALVLEQFGFPECAALLNTEFASLPPGVEIFAPGRIIAEEPLLIPVGCSLVGERGRRDFDNSWDNGGGTVIEYQADTGDIFAFAQADVGNNRMAIALENLIIRGTRVTRAGTATSGRGLVFNAPNQPGTAIHLYCRNVNVVECMEAGWWLEGPLYDVLLEYCGAHDCGKNGRKVLAGGADAIGEFTSINFRAFGNGALGSDRDQDGVWDAPGHTMVDVMLSASENFGNAVTKQAGLHTILGLQTESVPNGKSCLYVGSEGGGAGTGMCLVKGWKSNPGANFTGAHLHSTSDANHTRIEGVQFGDSLSGPGRHFITQGQSFHISGIRNITPQPLTYLNQSDDAFVENPARVGENLERTFVSAYLSASTGGITGNAAQPTTVFDDERIDQLGEYNSGTGIWTARSAKRVRVTAFWALGTLVATYDRAGAYLVCSDASQNIAEAHPNPYAVRDANDRTYLKVSGIFNVVKGATIQAQPQLTGGPTNAAILLGTLCRLQIEEIG